MTRNDTYWKNIFSILGKTTKAGDFLLYYVYIFQEVIIKTNFFNSGKKIAKLEEESIIVEKVFKAAKSAGIKKLRLRTAESVAGLSEK